MSIIGDGTVLIRRLDVTARLTDEVAKLVDRPEGGLLIETAVGRYVLDRDARAVWRLIDGRRDIGGLVECTMGSLDSPAPEVGQRVRDFAARLLELGLVEVVDPADIAALSRPV